MEVSCTKIKLCFYSLLILLVWINGYIQEVSCEDYMGKMQAVKNKIFKNYDKYVRPMNGTNTTEVFISFIPHQIMGLDEELALFSMDAYLFLQWWDPRLSWDESEYKGYLQLPSDMVWVPDISVHNSHSAKVDPIHDVLLAIDSFGNMWWVPPILTQTSCPTVSQVPYPRDEVECIIKMGSWMHDGWEIDYAHSEEVIMDEFVNINPSWELITSRVKAIRNVTYYDCCQEPYISILIHFPMRRRPVPAIEATRASCILVMILTLAIFWLPPDSSKKILLGGFLFVVLNVLLAYVGLSTKAPLSVLFGVSFIQTTMYLVVVTLLLQVFIVIKVASLSGPSRPSPSITQFLTGPVGKYVCLRSPMSEDRLSLDRVQLKEDSSTAENFSARDEWKLCAAAVDRALFIVMSIVMIAVHHL